MNLIDNALDAVPIGGHIMRDRLTGPDQVVVQIVDDGPGIPPEIQDARLRSVLHDQSGR